MSVQKDIRTSVNMIKREADAPHSHVPFITFIPVLLMGHGMPFMGTTAAGDRRPCRRFDQIDHTDDPGGMDEQKHCTMDTVTAAAEVVDME
jgi:hypothetical protein